MEKTINTICATYNNDRTRLMDILIDTQAALQGVEPAAMDLIADKLQLNRVEVEGVASFYSFFSTQKKGKIIIRLCDDIIDRHAGIEKLTAIFAEELDINVGQTTSDHQFSLEYTPCIGMSDQAPAALINQTVVTQLTPESVRQIAQELKQGIQPEKLTQPQGDGNNTNPLIKSMVKNHIRQVGEILLCDAPENIGLQKAIEKTPQQVLDEIDVSGLTGRGGAGFPTARKMQLANETKSTKRIIICNADEGEPGTFKDRVLLTERADLMIEGMTIAAKAIHSEEGLIYLRAEYAYLKPYLEQVLEQRRANNLLGNAICGDSEFYFDIRIQLGAGAYICGEESALISSCEGLRGEPKTRPPFPAQSGYLGHPTVVDNVETFCCIPRIIEKGSSWFRSFGTAKSTGTKLYSVCGDCDLPGIYELPFGTTVSELLEKAGGSDAAAVQVGGPSGQMINQSQFGRKLCNEDLPTGGSIMVFSEKRNILAIVDYFMAFFIDESCGYCTPCRVGNVFMKKRLEKIMKGYCQQEDLEYLKDLGNTISKTSRCGLGNTSPNPIISTIKNFPLVYAALLKENDDGLQASFDIQAALEESRRITKRRSMIYDPTYDEGS